MPSTSPSSAAGETGRPRGGFVVVAGPDGTGKSSLAASLVERLRTSGHPVRHFHHRFRALPASATSSRPTTEPHAQTPYPQWLSSIKVLYLFVDQLIGWLVTVRPLRRRGGWVVVERGWFDLAVDPLRYRIHPGDRLVERLGRLLPGADATIILVADERVIRQRKSELEPEELSRQLRRWQSLAERIPRAVVLEAGEPMEAVLESAVRALGIDQRTG
jgi:thymidylate kinase